MKSLQWTPESIVVSLLSARQQAIDLELPAAFGSTTVVAGTATVRPTDRENARLLTLPAGQVVTLNIERH